MIKTIGTLALIAGIIMIASGIMGILGTLQLGMAPWVFAVFGMGFFVSGISLIINAKNTDLIA